MARVARPGVREQLVHRAPVLHQDQCACEPHLGVQKSERGLPLELPDHARHRRGDGKPSVDERRPVDPHADEENDEVAVERGREAL